MFTHKHTHILDFDVHFAFGLSRLCSLASVLFLSSIRKETVPSAAAAPSDIDGDDDDPK